MCFSSILQVDKYEIITKNYEMNSWSVAPTRIKIISLTGLLDVHCILYHSGYFDKATIGLGFQVLFQNILIIIDNFLPFHYIYYYLFFYNIFIT